ncbi:unnamed protein product [Nyctereutes procyonoides]|uniref:ATP synthase peripheral stalk subunit F6, mitochondrial n=1 Tax=Nyctereutes procyonoides TaxID=34880 RepID=A0A811ZCH4_NYCPR|nr:unnamed protein product [Nyctereutes procyonoides]
MILQRLFRFSSLIRSAVSVHLRRETLVLQQVQANLERELFKLKQMYGKADMNTFPDFKFEDPKFEVLDKPQS